MGFAAPAWLLGLLLVPVMWYLHRTGPVLRRHPVESLALWRAAEARPDSPGARRRPDPAWIRRAAICSLLAVALAGPTLPRPAERVTLWIDDSLSMATAEDGRTRLDAALAAASDALRADGVADLEVRTLGAPWRALGDLDAGTVGQWRMTAGSTEPDPPDAGFLDVSRAHWLVTDGADSDVNAWVESAPIQRVFQAGAERRNVGIARLAVRPQPGDASAWAVMVTLMNGGDAAEARRVEVLAQGGAPQTREFSLEPGATTTVALEIPSGSREVVARLSPTDALAADDVVKVDSSALAPIPVTLDPACPDSVSRAVRAHPALRVANKTGFDLAIACGAIPASGDDVPRVIFTTGAMANHEAESVIVSASAAPWLGALPLGQVLRTRGSVGPTNQRDTVLLEADGSPLIVLRPGPPRDVETSLDPQPAGLGADEALPMLLGQLVDLAASESLLDREVHAGLGAGASRVAPLADLRARPTPASAASADDSLIAPLLWLALALLLWDAFTLVRRLARARQRTPEAAS